MPVVAKSKEDLKAEIDSSSSVEGQQPGASAPAAALAEESEPNVQVGQGVVQSEEVVEKADQPKSEAVSTGKTLEDRAVEDIMETAGATEDKARAFVQANKPGPGEKDPEPEPEPEPVPQQGIAPVPPALPPLPGEKPEKSERKSGRKEIPKAQGEEKVDPDKKVVVRVVAGKELVVKKYKGLKKKQAFETSRGKFMIMGYEILKEGGKDKLKLKVTIINGCLNEKRKRVIYEEDLRKAINKIEELKNYHNYDISLYDKEVKVVTSKELEEKKARISKKLDKVKDKVKKKALEEKLEKAVFIEDIENIEEMLKKISEEKLGYIKLSWSDYFVSNDNIFKITHYKISNEEKSLTLKIEPFGTSDKSKLRKEDLLFTIKTNFELREVYDEGKEVIVEWAKGKQEKNRLRLQTNQK